MRRRQFGSLCAAGLFTRPAVAWENHAWHFPHVFGAGEGHIHPAFEWSHVAARNRLRRFHGISLDARPRMDLQLFVGLGTTKRVTSMDNPCLSRRQVTQGKTGLTPGTKVLALVTDAFGGRGGIAQYNRDFLSTLIGFEEVSSVTVLPRYIYGRAKIPDGIDQLPPRRGRAAYSAVALYSALANPVDVVFCGHLYMAPLALIVARSCRAKLIMQMHGIEAWPRPSRLCRAATAEADLVLCVSRHTRDAVLAWTSQASKRIIVMPNTVQDAFTVGDGTELRSEMGLNGKRILLTVSRLDSRQRHKGHDRIIRALPQIVEQGHDAIYVVVGGGDDEGRLRALARERGVLERVRFMGEVGQSTLIDAYRMADLFVMPSTGEGFGIVFLEAMACGTPALGLDIGGAKDALADGELGTTVSEAELSTAIVRLLSTSPANPAALSRAVRQRFGRKPFAKRLKNAVDQLC